MSAGTLTFTQSKHGPLLTRRQWSWLVMQLLVVGVCLIISHLENPDRLRLLWQDPLGIRLSLIACGMLLTNALAFGAGCVLLNRWIGLQSLVLRPTLVATVAGICLFFLYLPAVFVVLNGPAAISVQRALAV